MRQLSYGRADLLSCWYYNRKEEPKPEPPKEFPEGAKRWKWHRDHIMRELQAVFEQLDEAEDEVEIQRLKGKRDGLSAALDDMSAPSRWYEVGATDDPPFD